MVAIVALVGFSDDFILDFTDEIILGFFTVGFLSDRFYWLLLMVSIDGVFPNWIISGFFTDNIIPNCFSDSFFCLLFIDST